MKKHGEISTYFRLKHRCGEKSDIFRTVYPNKNHATTHPEYTTVQKSYQYNHFDQTMPSFWSNCPYGGIDWNYSVACQSLAKVLKAEKAHFKNHIHAQLHQLWIKI